VPHAEDTFRLAHFSRLIKLPQNHPKLNHKISAYPRKSSYTSLPAIIPEKDNLYFRPEGVVARARQVIFSPSAFILDKLPRGPP
jgi:hypothetical protein